MGSEPTYCTFDIDFVDPAHAPGTGAHEIKGPTSFQAKQTIRELVGVNLIGDRSASQWPTKQRGSYGSSWQEGERIKSHKRAPKNREPKLRFRM